MPSTASYPDSLVRNPDGVLRRAGPRLALVAGLLCPASRAATLTWDANGTAAGQTDGSASWLAADLWWDGAANATWNNGTPDDAIIGNGGAGGTITLGAVSAGTVTFGAFSGGYTLTGGSLDQTGGVIIAAGAANVTIGSVISGAGGLTKRGASQLTLSGANSFTGPLGIENGRVFTTAVNNKAANGALGAGTSIVLGSTGQTGRLAVLMDAAASTNKDITLAAGGTGEIQFGNVSAASFQITNADRPLTLSGTLSGSGNFVKLGGAAVVLTGSNDYSGSTTVTEGPLRLGSANALPGGIGATGGATALTIHGANAAGAVVGLTAAGGDFLRGLGMGADQFQVPGGLSGFEATGSARQVIVNNDPAFELQWGIPAFNPSAFLLGYHAQTATGALTLRNRIDLNGATRTIAVNGGTAILAGDVRTSVGTAGLVKTGAGTLALTGSNTYNGATAILGGTLTAGTSSLFASTSGIQIAAGARLDVNVANQSLEKLAASGGLPAGAILRYSQPQTTAGAANGPGSLLGTVELNATNVNPDYTLDFGAGSSLQNLVAATYASPITLSGNAAMNASAAVFTLNGGASSSTPGTKTLELAGSNTGANTFGGVIGNGAGIVAVTKTGGGSWTLTAANAHGGATTVAGGTLTLGGADGSVTGSPVRISGGTLTVANTGAANNGDRLGDALAFTMNGGTFNFNNTAGAGNNFSERAGTLSITGGGNTVAIQQAAAGQTSALTFAGLSWTRGALNFTGAGLDAAVDPRGSITFTSAPALVDGILGPWATVNGITYASLSGNDLVTYGGPLNDVTRQSSGSKIIPDSASEHVRITEGTGGSPASLTLAAGTTTIRSLLNSSSGGAGAVTMDISSGQTLRVNSIHSVPTMGALTLGTAANTGTLTSATSGGDLLLINSSTAANLANANNNLTVNSVIIDHTTATTVTKDGVGVLRLSANNTYSGGTLINAGTVVVKADANLGAAGSGIIFNGASALSFGNHPAVGSLTVNLGTRPIAINNGAVVGLHHNWADTTITIGGPVTGTGGFIWGRDPVLGYNGGSGGVFLNLNSTGNEFTGPITIGMGTENAQAGTSQFNVSSLADSTQPITFNFGGAVAFNLNAVGPTASLSLPNRPIDLLNSTTTFRNLNTTHTLTLGPISTSSQGAKTLNLGAGGAGGIVAGAITNGAGTGTLGVNKNGGGTWALSGNNTYTGQTNIADGGGTLAFRNADQSLSPGSTITIGGSAGLTLLDDSSGTIHLGNNVNLNVAGTGERDGPTIFVGNNGGFTTGSTIALGVVDLVAGGSDARSTQVIHVTGANGYRLQLGGLIMGKRADHGAPQINPTTAPVTIAGTVTQASGKLASDSTAGDQLQLVGTATGNGISGVIRDAADYPANPSAKPFNLFKGGTGSWTLSGTNTYTGTTTHSAGKLFIDGNQSAATGALTVAANATLGGRGTLGGAVSVSANGKLEFNLSTPAAGHDSLDVVAGKTFTFSGASTLTITSAGGASPGVYTLVNAPGGLIGTAPATLNLPPDWVATAAIDGNKLVLDVTSTGVAINYSGWQAANGTTQAVDGDHDGDGVTNGIEWFIHGLNASSGPDTSPGVFSNAGGLTVVWTKHPDFNGAYAVESADAPQGPWSPETVGDRVAIVGDQIRFTFASPLPNRKYARLKITGP